VLRFNKNLLFSKKYLSIITIIICLFGCIKKDDQKYLPKGYFRIDLPEKKLNKQSFVLKDNMFSISIPNYFKYSTDTIKNEVYLINTQHNIGIILNYKKIENNLEKLITETKNVINDPQLLKMSYGIIETTSPDQKWSIYKMTGPVATPFLFHITDNKNHFLQGFMLMCADQNKKCNLNIDSLIHLINFFEIDIYNLANDIIWDE